MEYREEKVNEASSENLEWYNTELMNAENKFMALHENEIKQMLEPHLEEINTTLEAEFGDQIDIIETEIENLKSSWNIEDEAKQEEFVSNAVDVVNNMIKNNEFDPKTDQEFQDKVLEIAIKSGFPKLEKEIHFESFFDID